MKKLYKTITYLLTLVFVFAFVATPVYAVRTQTVWTATGEGGVSVIPYVRVDKRALFVDFEHKDFGNVEYFSYNLKYDTDELESKRGIEGVVYPRIAAVFGEYKGVPYIRRELPFGTCSGNDCVYYKNPNGMTLTVNTMFLSGKILEHTKVLSIPDNQL